MRGLNAYSLSKFSRSEGPKMADDLRLVGVVSGVASTSLTQRPRLSVAFTNPA